MVRIVTVLVGLLLLAPGIASAGEAEVEVLGGQLLHEDMEIARQASKELRALGAEAAPALPQLLLALRRDLDPRVARLHWHPWMGSIRELHVNVIATLEAIGPGAGAAAPVLAARLGRAGRPYADSIVRALLSVGPEKDATLRVFIDVLPRLWPRLPDETKTKLRAWIEARGTAAIPVLAGLLDRIGGDDKQWVMARLAAFEDVGLDALGSHLDAAKPAQAKLMVQLFAKQGKIPESLLPEAMRLFGADEVADADSVAAALVKAVTADDALVPPLAEALADLDPSQRPWRLLWEASPELAQRVSAAWFAGHRPADSEAPFDDIGLRRTATRGGGGGGAFEDRLSVRATLVGFHVWRGHWSGHTILTAIKPIYSGKEGTVVGSAHGQARGKHHQVLAREGYAVGGLYARGGHRVDGLAVVYFPWGEDGLRREGAFVGPWIGGTGGGGAILIGGSGRRVVGIHGRKGADLDALGLVEARK